MKCDLCESEIEDFNNAWMSWFMRATAENPHRATKFVAYAITCHPGVCEEKHDRSEKRYAMLAVGNPDLVEHDDMLYDHYVTNVAGRFKEWAHDYNVPGLVVAEVAIRLSPLLVELHSADITQADLDAARKERE